MKYDNIQIVKTLDGSQTIKVADIDEHYHSVNGAMQESQHVFINSGFHYILKDKLSIFETGFGTGLNAMLTFYEAEKFNKTVDYTTLELYPLDEKIFSQLNYAEMLNLDANKYFLPLHTCEWNKNIELSKNFTFKKINIDLNKYSDNKRFDIIYFDAFAPDKQRELWTETIFGNMFSLLNDGGILVTYSAKGEVKRNLRSAGFTVTRLQGAAGKHHMLQAKKQVL
ncbi:MAG: tRNA (5-methylaminomethyl-2-thiouridine)(34)-methyltransferase MnmD [Prevotellaceae bacterium]|jgi:tRNA U34 5-methylaminomethyl-2-thiouridine-forming methyltransferase MnmC|nr:tRNA (5-methylaminomethyl-2-thiouridine)(34)-methyltransferase MnmD [Prevotellaceae bacterium]